MTHRLPLAFVLVCGLVAGGTQASTTTPANVPHTNTVPVFSHVLPNVARKAITGVVVTYKPGEGTPPHHHDSAFVVAYILSGSIRSQLEGDKAKVYHVGESFSENPGAHHIVSENASKTEPASFLAIFVSASSDPAPLELDEH